MLLADDRPRQHASLSDAQPPHRRPRREPPLQHQVQRDERAGPPQPRLAVHRHQPLRRVHDVQEAPHHVRRRRGAVVEVEVVVADAVRGEVAAVLLGLVEPHHRLFAQQGNGRSICAGS
jgi:hypothetical protein